MKVATKSGILCLVALTALSACQVASRHHLAELDPADTKTAMAEIDALRQRLEESFSAGDLEGMALVYAEDAAFSAPGRPIVQGRDAIRSVFETKRPPAATAEFRPLETRILAPHWAYEFGTITVTAKVEGTLLSSESTYLVIFRRNAAGWRIYRESLSSNQPLPAAQ